MTHEAIILWCGVGALIAAAIVNAHGRIWVSRHIERCAQVLAKATAAQEGAATTHAEAIALHEKTLGVAERAIASQREFGVRIALPLVRQMDDATGVPCVGGHCLDVNDPAKVRACAEGDIRAYAEAHVDRVVAGLES